MPSSLGLSEATSHLHLELGTVSIRRHPRGGSLAQAASLRWTFYFCCLGGASWARRRAFLTGLTAGGASAALASAASACFPSPRTRWASPSRAQPLLPSARRTTSSYSKTCGRVVTA